MLSTDYSVRNQVGEFFMLKENDEGGNLYFYKYRNNRNSEYLRNEKREKRGFTLKYFKIYVII